MQISKTALILIFVGLLVIGGIAGYYLKYYQEKNRCMGERGYVGFVFGGQEGNCCDGLTAKSPKGYACGDFCAAFCVKPECEVECGAIGTRSEGLYLTGCEMPPGGKALIEYANCG